MRIVCAVHDYPPQRVTGSAQLARRLCRGLGARGHDVTVVSSARLREGPGDPRDPGVRVDRIGRGLATGLARQVVHPLRGWLGSDPTGLAGPLHAVLMHRIRRARPDLILSLAVPTPEVVAAAGAARRLGVPAVAIPAYHVHQPGFVTREAQWLHTLGAFDALLVATHEEQAFFVDRGLQAGRIEHFRMPVEPPPPVGAGAVRAWRRARGIDDALLVVAAGSYSEQKGVWTLARAAQALPQVRFVLLGGDERARRDLCAAVAVGPNVHFAGFVDETQKAHWLHAADLLAMPSCGDSFGLVYVEANACGTPALAADLPAMREVLGPDGTFVPLDDPAALAAAIGDRLPAFWRRPEVRESARKNADRYAPEPAVSELVDALEARAAAR
ncbi:MAG: glycosyltransferase family 4 protein [Myxococcota bacterium]